MRWPAALPEMVDEQLNESLIETAQIAFFLLGAMTIVEVVDAHDGFDVITSRLQAAHAGDADDVHRAS